MGKQTLSTLRFARDTKDVMPKKYTYKVNLNSLDKVFTLIVSKNIEGQGQGLNLAIILNSGQCRSKWPGHNDSGHQMSEMSTSSKAMSCLSHGFVFVFVFVFSLFQLSFGWSSDVPPRGKACCPAPHIPGSHAGKF